MLKMWSCVFILCYFVVGMKTFQFLHSNDRVIVEDNELKMNCSLIADLGESFTKSELNIKWSKMNDDGDELIADNDNLIIKDDRFKINLNFDDESIYFLKSVESILTIDDIDLMDSGKYKCEITTRQYTNNGDIDIDVLSSVIEVNALVGNDVNLNCIDDTYDISEISYSPNFGDFKEGDEIKYNQLIINTVTFDDSMKYECSVKLNNDNNDVINRVIHLYVLNPLEVYTYNTLYKRSYGSNIELTCFVYSFPQVDVKWLNKVGNLIEDTPDIKFTQNIIYNNEYSVSNYDSNDYHIFNSKWLKMAKLYINNLTYTDRGSYQCVVSNEYDVLKQKFDVRVKKYDSSIENFISEIDYLDKLNNNVDNLDL